MPPPFFFQVDEIRHRVDSYNNYDPMGSWRPSSAGGAHARLSVQGVTNRTWLCDGRQITEQHGLPHGSHPYKTFSLYYSAGRGIFVLSSDATVPCEWETWKSLSFLYSQANLSSDLTNAGQHPRLYIQRDDQQWPRLLLPDIYHASGRTENYHHGGLKGELAILLGLYVLSTSFNMVGGVLPHCFQGGTWRVHQWKQPRDDKRGVIVKIYTCPQNICGGSTWESLSDYENGSCGNFLN